MRAIVNHDFGASIDSLFEELNEEPLAAGSIGRIYRANHDVAVKIHDPRIADTIIKSNAFRSQYPHGAQVTLWCWPFHQARMRNIVACN